MEELWKATHLSKPLAVTPEGVEFADETSIFCYIKLHIENVFTQSLYDFGKFFERLTFFKTGRNCSSELSAVLFGITCSFSLLVSILGETSLW